MEETGVALSGHLGAPSALGPGSLRFLCRAGSCSTGQESLKGRHCPVPLSLGVALPLGLFVNFTQH